jgi:hypothetical protein
MTDEQALGCEGVWLDVDIGAGDASEEARLANIGVAANQQRTGVGVDGWQTTKMLSDLIEVEQRIFQTLANGGHATESSLLELLALEERLSILEQADVVAGDGLDQVLGRGELTEGDLEMVGIVKCVEQILVERVDVLEARKALEDSAELVGKRFLGELDLTSVESCTQGGMSVKCLMAQPSLILTSNSADLEA